MKSFVVVVDVYLLVLVCMSSLGQRIACESEYSFDLSVCIIMNAEVREGEKT